MSREYELRATASAQLAGLVHMHNGGWCISDGTDGFRYKQHGTYTPFTAAQLDELVAAGLLYKEYGKRVHVGGILSNWVPETR